ncbi:MAG: winged helix-turn-helix transcriptional regulator [Gemmatimonadota bacterium]
MPPCGCGTPGLAAADSCYCAVDDVLRIIRRRYSLSVLNVIRARGSVRYTEIAGALAGVSSSTLSETLLALETAQLVTRTDLSGEGAPHTNYGLTASGEKLVHKLRVLLEEIQHSG